MTDLREIPIGPECAQQFGESPRRLVDGARRPVDPWLVSDLDLSTPEGREALGARVAYALLGEGKGC